MNKMKRIATLLFVIGTAMIVVNMLVSGEGEAANNAVNFVGTILDLVAVVLFLRGHKDDTGSYY